MSENIDKINALEARLNDLLRTNDLLAQQLSEVKQELQRLKYAHAPVKDPQQVSLDTRSEVLPDVTTKTTAVKSDEKRKPKTDLERFIGENLINKIGIVITIIGVAIGAKYSIDRELISPPMRIAIAYAVGAALLLFGLRLRKNYENFSAVLVSGAMAIMYFVSYAAYDFYGFFDQTTAFILMVILTIGTVVAALKYNQVVIAQIGLVGAYAVPLLLSDGSGRVHVLFSYMVIINAGILTLSLMKYWKSLYYSSFIITWVIFFSWYYTSYVQEQHFALALTFLSIFFAIFYTIFLAYKLFRKDKFNFDDVLLLLSNSFIFYGVGYSILADYHPKIPAMFTLTNAFVHLIVSLALREKKLIDRNVYYLTMGLFLVFMTIAIPVQFNGNWVTMLWAFEAALLFWIGRTKHVYLYERLSYSLIILAFLSIVHDWIVATEQNAESYVPFLNIDFVSSLLFVGALAFINYTHANKSYLVPVTSSATVRNARDFLIPIILFLSIYFAFRIEIEIYWNSRLNVDPQAQELKTLWLLNYSLLFLVLLTLFNVRKFKSTALVWVNLIANFFSIAAFLFVGLSTLESLQASPAKSSEHLIRYIGYALVAALLYLTRGYKEFSAIKSKIQSRKIVYDIFVHATVLWLACGELIHWLISFQVPESTSLGLTILWGVYSLMLIIIGISRKKKHLRIAAITLFTVTLIKLFLYDLIGLSTLARTVVFVLLGLLLLVISFLYNKYKQLL
jgi:uncharacterized membrane protein